MGQDHGERIRDKEKSKKGAWLIEVGAVQYKVGGWSFRAGALLNRSFSFLFPLLSRASPPFVSYDMDHLSTVKSKEGHGPSLLVAVETDTRSARIVWCSCFRLRGRKHGYGEHTA